MKPKDVLCPRIVGMPMFRHRFRDNLGRPADEIKGLGHVTFLQRFNGQVVTLDCKLIHLVIGLLGSAFYGSIDNKVWYSNHPPSIVERVTTKIRAAKEERRPGARGTSFTL